MTKETNFYSTKTVIVNIFQWQVISYKPGTYETDTRYAALHNYCTTKLQCLALHN